jgi:Transcriptional regulator, AbiEi antitoxin
MASSSSFHSIAAFAADHHGVVTRAQAATLGVGRMVVSRLVERGALVVFGPGVLIVAGSPRTWEQRLYAATMLCREQGLAVGASAARLHGVDGFERSEVVHVAFPRGRRPSVPGVVISDNGQTYPRADRHRINGIACAGLARTVCDLAVMGADVVERSTDHFLRSGYSLTWLARTAARLQTRGRKGLPLVTAEIERRMVEPGLRGSWFEKVAETCLASPRIPGLERQFVIRDGAGMFLARADLAVPLVKFAIEAHSRRFHFGRRQEVIDERRERLVVAEGWLVEYLGWFDVQQTPAAVCRYIERVVARRALDLGVDLPVS